MRLSLAILGGTKERKTNMKVYLVSYKFYYDGEMMSSRYSTQLREDPREEEYSGTDFEGLWNLAHQWSSLIPLGRFEIKKGKRFLQHYDWFVKKITPKNCKPWKLTINSVETIISMEHLMEFNSENVIQYLKERGITTCPMNF